jgi:predicted lipoprotein with Yx(FWY)xxD motif
MRPTHLLTCAAVAASLALAACGGDDTSTTTSGAAAATSDTVHVKHVDSLGDVLVDSTGKALYTPEKETAKKIRCTGDCLTFWQPLEAGAGKPTAADGVGPLAVIDRPDGKRQVTADGKPLYTFSEDTAAKITGDGFHDEFGGRSFVWHVVLAGSGPAPASTSTPSSSSSGSGNYGY